MEKNLTVSNTGKVSCTICNKSFYRKNNLQFHIDRVHSQIIHPTQQTGSSESQKKKNREDSTCQICGKIFRERV